ncbi:MAG: hypothetical protein ACTSRJ_04810 [Candidatus Hodarchaeales archaeon]
MANTDLSYYANDVLIERNGYAGTEWYQAGDSLIKPGYLVMEDDVDEVKIAATDEVPYGIAGLKAGHEIDTVYAAGERITVFPIGSGCVVWAKHDGTNETILKNSAMVISAGTELTL